MMKGLNSTLSLPFHLSCQHDSTFQFGLALALTVVNDSHTVVDFYESDHPGRVHTSVNVRQGDMLIISGKARDMIFGVSARTRDILPILNSQQVVRLKRSKCLVL